MTIAQLMHRLMELCLAKGDVVKVYLATDTQGRGDDPPGFKAWIERDDGSHCLTETADDPEAALEGLVKRLEGVVVVELKAKRDSLKRSADEIQRKIRAIEEGRTL